VDAQRLEAEHGRRGRVADESAKPHHSFALPDVLFAPPLWPVIFALRSQMGHRLFGGIPERPVQAEGPPADRLSGRAGLSQAALQEAEGARVKASESCRGEQNGIGALGLKRRWQQVATADYEHGSGMALVSKAPEQAGEET
jgi:hypothetical protein